MYSFMIAIGENREMGVDNRLPWHLPGELRHFRQHTEHHTIIMGRKTFESLPRILPNRTHLILTRNGDYGIEDPQVEVFHSLEALLERTRGEEEVFVIGGDEIFRLFYPYAGRIYLTVVHGSFPADTWFMELPPEEWETVKTWEGTVDEETRIPHTYHILERKKQR